MDRTSTVTIAGFLTIGVAFFLFMAFVSRGGVDTADELTDTRPGTDWTTSPAVNDGTSTKEILVTPKTVVTAKHAYRSGAHIIAGEVPLPTPCHLLEAKGVASADKKEVLIEIASSIKTGEMCVQVITPARFKVSVKASQGAKLNATLNGQAVTLNLIEAGPDEDLDNFELYIKG